MYFPLLRDILVILTLALAVLFICNKLRIPVIVGFLVTGVVAGPHGFKLVEAPGEVETLAEVGVIFLLFTIGLEFSVRKLLHLRRAALLGGSLQVGLSIVIAALMLLLFRLEAREAIFAGFLVSLSSTAIVLKILQQKAQVDTPFGQVTLAILIFQDIIAVVMMLFIPVLAGNGMTPGRPLLWFALRAGAILALAYISARWLVPKLLYQIASTRVPELFMLAIVAICLAVAWLTNMAGLSLALGAFLAGLIIAESEYSYQALSTVMPFRDIFLSFFFVSIGMLLSLDFFTGHWQLIILIAAAVIFYKFVVAATANALAGYTLRIAILAGAALSQVGEFSFILAKTGMDLRLLSPELYQLFLAVSVLTMAATPLMMARPDALADQLLKLPFPERLKKEAFPRRGAGPGKLELKDHLVIIGYGIIGRNVARAARIAGINYAVIEMNPETVRREKAGGVPIIFGDGVHDAVLKAASVDKARVAVVAIADASATRRITANLRRLNPAMHIIARTRFTLEMPPLYQLGANEVIPEEYETSVTVFARVLARYMVPEDEVQKFVSQIRAEGYRKFRNFRRRPEKLFELEVQIPELDTRTLRIRENSAAVGKSLAQIGLRRKFGVTALALKRGDALNSNPDPDTVLEPGDLIVVLGSPEKISQAARLFAAK